MSRGFVKEGDQEEVPMVLPRVFLPSGTPNYVTLEGLKKLHDEMESLKKEWTEAGSNYVAKNHIDAKMRQLSERINSAIVIDSTKANPDVVSFGMYVKYNDKVIRIVGVDEAVASQGLISFISPMAKSLIGKKKGDKFEVKVPRGTETVEVQEINTHPTQTTNPHESPRTNISVNSCTLVDKNNHPTQTTNQHESTRTNISANSCALVDKTTHPTQTTNQHESTRTNLSANSCTLVDKDNHPTQTSTQHESPRTNISANSCTLVDKNNLTDDESTKIVQLPQNDFTEFLPIVNERGNIIGRALHLEIHNGNKVMHPAVHLLVYNTKKEIVAKYWWHVAFGETVEKTLKRKLKEIESQTIKPKFKKQYIREDKNEKELVSVFTATTDEEIIPSPSDKEYEAMFLKSTN